MALAAGLAAVVVVGAGGFLLGRGTTERPPAVAAPRPVAQPAADPGLEEEQGDGGVLSRADVLALAATAADATASGRWASPKAIEELKAAEGRRFEIGLPFGCSGPVAEGSEVPTGWRYDEAEGVLRVRATPLAWTPEDWGTAAGPVEAEAIEGFWVARPWISGEACPDVSANAPRAGTEAVTLPGQTLAVAQFFTADGPRRGRRDGRAYQTSVKIAPESFDSAAGFRLRLSGRIGRTPGGTPVLCRQSGGAEQRPICVIAVILDEVSIVRGDDGATLATWNVDGQATEEGADISAAQKTDR